MTRSRHSIAEAVADILRASMGHVGTGRRSGDHGLGNGNLHHYLGFLLAHEFIVPADSEGVSLEYRATDKGTRLLQVIDSIL